MSDVYEFVHFETIKKSIPVCGDARTFLKAVSGKSKSQRAHVVTHGYKGEKKFYGVRSINLMERKLASLMGSLRRRVKT